MSNRTIDTLYVSVRLLVIWGEVSVCCRVAVLCEWVVYILKEPREVLQHGKRPYLLCSAEWSTNSFSFCYWSWLCEWETGPPHRRVSVVTSLLTLSFLVQLTGDKRDRSAGQQPPATTERSPRHTITAHEQPYEYIVILWNSEQATLSKQYKHIYTQAWYRPDIQTCPYSTINRCPD